MNYFFTFHIKYANIILTMIFVNIILGGKIEKQTLAQIVANEKLNCRKIIFKERRHKIWQPF